MPSSNDYSSSGAIIANLSRVLSLAMILVIVSGCAPRHSVILMPDPSGHVGSAEVITDSGKQVLEKSGEMTVVSGRTASPSPPVEVDPTYISATFADALSVEPLPSEKFILLFETGETNLVAESQATIPAILTAINRRSAISISISGHTDAVGSIQFNDKLAHDRALAIRALLIRNGVNQDRLIVSSHGKGNPIVPTPDGVAEPRNRRVEVIVR